LYTSRAEPNWVGAGDAKKAEQRDEINNARNVTTMSLGSSLAQNLPIK
jgi:hypothetical protein